MIASPVIAKNKKPAFDYQAFLDEAYSRLTVEQIYTHPSHQFKQSGEKYRGGCPYHDSQSGTSFSVTAGNLLFNCAGCQSGGSAIGYLHSLKVGRWEKPRGKDFIEAAKHLAQIAGMTFPDFERSPEEIEKVRQWESRREILQAVIEYGEEVLWSSRGIDARNYLINERGFTEEQIKSLNLGLYLNYKEVEKVLLAKGHNLDDAKNAGVIRSELKGYILFPWSDSQGRSLTIYGRYQDKVPPEGKPKTIALKGEGTKQSPLYFDRVLKAGHRDIVLVEGVIDAALLQVKGDTRVCAYVGASCSDLQIKTLVHRRIKSVTLCGDPDTGGDNGTMSNIKRIMSVDIDVYVAPRLTDGLDPDEFVNKVGIEGWKNHIDNAVHAFTYMARFILHKHDITNDRGKISAISEAFNYTKQFTQQKSKLSIEVLFWAEICERLGIDKQELVGRFQTSAGDEDNSETDNEHQINVQNNKSSSEEFLWRRQRQNWKSPVSHQGEIGFWVTDKDDNTFFVPACNFDFQVEREIKDADGGGLVLQVKRLVDDKQVRVILNSTDYTKPDSFTDALKRALQTGIVCNLSKTQLNALMHTRLHEYRTTRQGRLFKRIDRYGQQADGIWVFSDRQYQKDGTPTNENESRWVFNSSLGKEDFIPCPELAEENPQALKILVDASREFFGQQNIYQVLLKMGWVVAGLNFQEIYRQINCFPLENSYGPPGSCKTLASETALSLVGKNWAEHGMLARVSTSALYEHGARTGSLPFFWDDPDRNPENEELAKNWYNCKPRRVRGNQQTPHSPMGIASNHVFGGEQAATYTRFIRLPFEKATSGDKAAFQKLKAAQAEASGAFPQLIAIGYPKDEINEIESELLQYLPLAHARIAQSLAIVTWYAQKVVDMTGGGENIKQWVIENCCQAENDSDASGDSLKDYLTKILTLESENLIGDWNFKRNVERDGQLYHALYAHDAWKLLDHRFKPATYNERSLKALVIKAGGITNTTFRFSSDRDLVLAYRRAFLNLRTDEDGNSILPRPPGTLPRKAWLIPAALWDEEGNTDKPVTNIVTTVTNCNQNPVTPSNPDAIRDFEPSNTNCNHVTNKNELEKEKDDEKKINTIVNPPPPGIEPCNQNSGYAGYTPFESEKTEENQDFEPVTEDQLQQVTRLQPVQEARPQQNTASKSPRDRISDAWENDLKLGEIVLNADQGELDRALAQCNSEQIAVMNNAAIAVDELNEDSLYPPGILIDHQVVVDKAGYIQKLIANSSWEMIAEQIVNWKPKFETAVWRELSPEERKIVKQLKAEALSSESATPPSGNLVDPPSEPNSGQGVDAHQWKRHDRAIYCGQEVSLERVSPDDNLVTVRYQDEQREEVSKFLLEIWRE